MTAASTSNPSASSVSATSATAAAAAPQSYLDRLRQYYFQQYASSYTYNPQHHLLTNFRALSKSKGWNIEQRLQQRGQMNAIICEVVLFDLEKLHALQSICQRYHLTDIRGAIPATITQCKLLIQSLHVNLYDFIDGSPRTFISVHELAKHSKKKGKIFPKLIAKSKPELKVLLRMF